MGEVIAPDAAVLGRLLLLQSTLQTAVTEGQLATAVCRGLCGVPGVTGCVLCVDGTILASSVAEWEAPWKCGNFQELCLSQMSMPLGCPLDGEGSFVRKGLVTGRSGYGGLLLKINDPKLWAPYEPFVGNTANLVALHIENQRQAGELKALVENLEDTVASRTRDLEEKKLRAELALHAGHLGAWEWRIDEDVLIYDKRIESIFGMPPLWGKSSNYLERIPAESRRRVKRRIQRHLTARNHEKRFCIEHKVQHPSGKAKWVKLWGQLHLDRKGYPERLIGICKDITEEKRKEMELRESEERYRDLVESSRALICTHDMEGRVISINAWATEILGYPHDVLLKMSIADILAAEYRHMFPQYLENIRQRGTASGIMTIQTAKGERRVWEYHNTVRTQGLPAPIVRCLAYDVTERIKAQEALREASERWHKTFDAITDAVVLLKPDLTIRQCNQAFMDLFGGKEKDVKGLRCHQVVHGTESQLENCPVLRLRQTHVREEMEMRFGDRTYQVSVDPVLGDGGKLTGVVHIMRDITEMKRAEEEKRRLERRLQQAQKAESLGRMAGAIAHHFNNLLGGVIGNLELALLDLPPGSQVREEIEQALKTSGRAAEIGHLLLTYIGQTTGRMDIFDLSEFCQEAMPLLHASLPQNVRIETEFSVPGPLIRADRVQMRQILTNLIVNAGEAMGSLEGCIKISVDVMDAAEMKGLRFHPLEWQPRNESYACLGVSDTGPGMDAETIEKAFDPFFSTKFTGRGLGLAVVLGMVKAHSGSVNVESTLGVGTRFRVFLPLSRVKVESPAALDRVEAEPASERGLVLVVEDEFILRKMAETMLHVLGYETLSAADGVEALEVFRNKGAKIQCVLLDLTMPRMGGWETLQALRKMAPKLPVVLASGYDEAHVMSQDYPERPQVFLHKPYRMADLKSAIDSAIGDFR